ncbi:ribokinase [Aliiroseovarius halocynthiae]|uniref:Ribokinase n=1 Tax=Aliiroseovarius halocynthiae TaxID=985055 RepID=A0A545SNP5_9RHOB|nr:ribokinase [Aliiroseovarius halocynthiae]TQV66581.1 ribokinase [Aliiroseovarius halocynthiae]SMR82549.1 ribokinase [Aliiroseovarius halocynthiae]
MTLFNLGSINIDNFYRVPHMPAPGETLTAQEHAVGLGGKGANQSVAAARAGADVVQIGAVGPDGQWCLDTLKGAGVDTTQVASRTVATGHANIVVDPSGENQIILYSGANHALTVDQIDAALAHGTPTDTLILQNETNMIVEAAKVARARGMRVIYSAAPFVAADAKAMLPHTDMLVLNQVEAQQLTDALGKTIADLNLPVVLITKGSEGAVWIESGVETAQVSAFPVTPVDTTGAGDCFIGYVAAGLDQGMTPEHAMRLGAAASAIKVTRFGTADAIPSRDEVDRFLAG